MQPPHRATVAPMHLPLQESLIRHTEAGRGGSGLKHRTAQNHGTLELGWCREGSGDWVIQFNLLALGEATEWQSRVKALEALTAAQCPLHCSPQGNERTRLLSRGGADPGQGRFLPCLPGLVPCLAHSRPPMHV